MAMNKNCQKNASENTKKIQKEIVQDNMFVKPFSFNE
jgi:hypothetical protein